MRTRLLSPLAMALACGAPAAMAQPQLPEGPGKAVIEQACFGCHEPVRIMNSGYSRQDWQNVVRMMLNVGAPVPADRVAVLADYLAKNFPEKPSRPPDRRRHARQDQGMDRADAGLAPARSAGRIRRLHLVHRPVRQRARPRRSRRPARSRNSVRRHTGLRPARPGRRQGRQHLVHRELPRATSASSIRRPASSPSTSCPPTRAIRTRRSSTRRAFCGSPCRTPTRSAGSIRRPGEIKMVDVAHAARIPTAW